MVRKAHTAKDEDEIRTSPKTPERTEAVLEPVHNATRNSRVNEM
jgi:hypothetical protein